MNPLRRLRLIPTAALIATAGLGAALWAFDYPSMAAWAGSPGETAAARPASAPAIPAIATGAAAPAASGPRQVAAPAGAYTPVLATAAAAGPVPAATAPAGPVPTTAAASGPGLTLQQALDLAADHSLSLQQAALQIPRARLGADRTDAAVRAGGPALTAALQQRYGVPLPPDTETTAALKQGADLGIQQAALALSAARQATRLAVTRAYVEWQKATALAEAQQAALNRATAQLANATAAVTAGSAARYDVIQAGAQLSAQQAALSGADAARESARLALERLMGEPVPAPKPESTLPGPDAAADLPAADLLLHKALRQRPDVAAARLGVQLKKADLTLLSRYLPDGDPTRSAAQLAVQEAALALESARADSAMQVQQALLGAGSARERLAALLDGETQAREALRLAGLRFDAGTATSVEVISAQAGLSAAEAARIQAQADLAAAMAALAQATGEL